MLFLYKATFNNQEFEEFKESFPLNSFRSRI